MVKFQAARNDILTTKLVPPRLPHSLVSRKALLRRLDDGLGRKLTLISAPAGSGKTTLAGEWASHVTSRDVAWISLDEGDNDPVRFWRYFLTACQKFGDEVGAAALEMLYGTQPPAYEAILTILINQLVELASPCVVVLEDYHVLSSEPIHAAVTFLLDHLPPDFHLVVLSRHEPPLPLARLRARDQLNEFGAADLRFSRSEIQEFLQQTIPVSLSPTAIEKLAGLTEGWAAGLRLAVLALQGKSQPTEQAVETFSSGQQRISEYFIDEVFATQPKTIQAFLLQTAYLNRLTADLCDAVTGRNDSKVLLKHLEDANLFLIPLEGKWYRYHALFAEALRHHASHAYEASSLQQLHKQASLWYEAHGFFTEAVEAACLGQDFERAASLIAEFVEPFHVSNEYYTLRRWIETFPAKILHVYPVVAFTYAVAILFSLDRRIPSTAALIREPLSIAESHWRMTGDQHRLGEVMVIRAMVAWWQGNLSESFSAARHALELLPEDDLSWRGTCLLPTSYEFLLAGQLESAQQAALEARACCEVVGNVHGVFAAMLISGHVHYHRGELHQAEQYYQQVLSEIDTSEQFLEDRAHIYLGLGLLAYEWNQLETAEQVASDALNIGKTLGAADEIVSGSLLLARVLHRRGKPSQAQQLLHALLVQIKAPHFVREVRACQARLALASGDLAAVQRWYTTTLPRNAVSVRLQEEQEALIAARLFTARGEVEAALDLLNRWQVDARKQGRSKSELEIIILKALAYAASGSEMKARQWLVQALELAHTEGYVRLFLDEGHAMTVLLRQTLPDLSKASATYARNLLMASSMSPTFPLDARLSPQEERILHLLAAGLSNPEIAQEFVVSINTVKTQIKSIYRKLNITRREEAVDVARHLKLN